MTQLLDVEVDVGVDPILFHHDRRYLQVIGVKDLRHLYWRKPPPAAMAQVATVLQSHLHPSRPLKDPVWAFIFAHGVTENNDTIPLASVHGVSVFSRTSDGLAHRYFERHEGDFVELEEAATAMSAMPDLDEIRMLHFGAFAVLQLPPTSTIYEFRADGWDLDNRSATHPALRRAVLLDAKRVGGAPTMGLHGDEVYTALLGGGANGTTNCGNSDSCGAGTGSCEPVPPSESAGYRCKADATGDPWVSVFTQAIRSGVVTADEANFPLIRAFVTEFLPASPLGEHLIAHYYTAGVTLSRTDEAIGAYAEALPALVEAASTLMSSPPDTLLVTPELRRSIDLVIGANRGIDHPITKDLAEALARSRRRAIRTKEDLLRELDMAR